MLLILETVVIDQVVFACQFSWEPNGNLRNDENTAILTKIIHVCRIEVVVLREWNEVLVRDETRSAGEPPLDCVHEGI